MPPSTMRLLRVRVPGPPSTSLGRSAPVIGASRRFYAQETSRRKPLRLSGALKGYKQFDVTPVLGTEFPDASLAEMVSAPNADELIRDLGITVARRGVVFFRAQHDMTNEIQKFLLQRMGELTNKPRESGLSVHVLLNPQTDKTLASVTGKQQTDPHLSTLNSRQRKATYGHHVPRDVGTSRQEINAWHSDIQSEPVPADFTTLRLTELPTTGGDTLWASGYEVYDRLSKPMQRFLESLDATYDAPFFTDLANKKGLAIYPGPRGHPDNVGTSLTTVHPVVRTNPVTGWKSVFALGAYVRQINGLHRTESDVLLQWLMDLVMRNHDLQCRFKWNGPNDMAIWDNRSMIHNATFDYDEYGERFGYRVCATGEHPYLDPDGLSRREALAMEKEEAS